MQEKKPELVMQADGFQLFDLFILRISSTFVIPNSAVAVASVRPLEKDNKPC